MADRAGFEEFVAARSPRLLRVCYLLTRDWASAEDLLQTSLAKAWFAWDWQLACARRAGAASVEIDGSARPVGCISPEKSEAGGEHTLTLTARRGSGGARVAVLGGLPTVVEQVSGS